MFSEVYSQHFLLFLSGILQILSILLFVELTSLEFMQVEIFLLEDIDILL